VGVEHLIAVFEGQGTYRRRMPLYPANVGLSQTVWLIPLCLA